MWLFTTMGFFSVVTATDAKGRPLPKRLAVRARKRSHLEKMREAWLKYGGEPRDFEILTTPEADYRHRVVLKTSDVCEFAAWMIESIDYGNFKDAAARLGDKAYSVLLGQIWSAGLMIQDRVAKR